jgi:hypothetical protein
LVSGGNNATVTDYGTLPARIAALEQRIELIMQENQVLRNMLSDNIDDNIDNNLTDDDEKTISSWRSRRSISGIDTP